MKTRLLFTFYFICLVSFGAVKFPKDSVVEVKKDYSQKQYSLNPSLLESQNFSWKNITKWYPTSSTTINDREKANSSFKVIEEHKSWVDTFSNEDIQELPVGVKYTKGNIQYAIGITQANIYKNYTELTVFARVRLPQTNQDGIPIELFFGANNVKLSHEGGIVGDANLVLLGDMHIPLNANKWMLTLKGGFNYTSGQTENKTYVTINCDGVKELAIEGEVEFSRGLILPVEADGKVNETITKVTEKIVTENGTQSIQVPYRVKGAFKIIASDWNDLLVGINLQPFVLAKKRNQKNYDGNFQFHVNEAVLDFSDLRNDTKVVFPKAYQENGLLLPNEKTWRGVYINTIEVRLPKEFKTTETISQDKRIAFGAHHLLLDNYGVSGSFYAENIFTLDKGRTNEKKAWAYSLDRIEVTLAANKLKKASFNGKIQLPVSKNDRKVGLNYKGIISEEEYSVTVSNDSVIDFNLWKAKGELLPNSVIEFKVKDGQFRPKAILHGRLAISASQKESLENEGETIKDASGKDKLVEFKGIEFQNLVLKTEGTVFSVDYMGYKGQSLLGNFPVSISKIGIIANETNANLYFDIGLNLMGENNGFAANTSLAIIGSFEERNHKQRWEFKELKLEAIYLKADMGGFSMEGSLKLMNNDPEYGDGFAASLKAKFKAFEGVAVQAKGVFGKKDFRYWQFEAMVDGLNVGTGVVNLQGFSGGASYRMRRTDFSSSFSPSGIGYAPDSDADLGVKAMVIFNTISKKILNGRAGFEIVFNRDGGINFLGFYGQATFMNVKIPEMDKVSGLMSKLKENTTARTKFLGVTDENTSNSWIGKNLLDKASGDFPQAPTDKMAISATLGITYDFENNVLHGELDSFVNVAGGFVKGIGPGGSAGKAVLHFAPKDWYIYVGTPKQPVGLQIGVGSIRVKTGGYFMTGSKLLPSPPPPPLVAEIIKVDRKELDYMRDENALASGGGFAFGSNLSIDTGDLRFLIFYANFKAEAGFDIMLRDYGKAKCSNTGKQVGINGWYANGQAYAAMQGELGVRIKLFFIKKKIPIIKGAAAVLLQAKAPNPIWMRGYMAGEFDLLGGLVKGGFRFKMSLGEECVFENGAPLGGLKIISDLTPAKDSKDIDVFTIPQASFSMKVGEPIVIPEDDGDKTYKIILEKYRILHKGKEIPGVIEWSKHKDRANFVSTDILPPHQQLTVEAEVSFKEKVNGVFRTIMVDGKPAIEKEARTFTTGDAPTVIPLHNITYAYPVLDQKYFLEKEYNQGYIKLRRGQDYLFDNTQWKSSIAYYDDEKIVSQKTFNYNTGDNILQYELPNISQKTKYHLSIISEPKNAGNSSNNTNNDNDYEKVDLNSNSEGNSVEIQKIKANNISKESGSIERLAYNFKTSEYKTFEKKINAIRVDDYKWFPIYSDVIYLNNTIKNHEPFELNDLKGGVYTADKPLVTIEATLEDDYYKKDIYPPLYAKYPMSGHRFTNRDENKLGTPPKLALPIIESYLTNLEYDVNKHELETIFPFRYNLGLSYYFDWEDLHSQLVNAHIDGFIKGNDPVLNFLDKHYLFMRYGFYKTKLIYNLPGGKKGSEAIFKFKNPNKFR